MFPEQQCASSPEPYPVSVLAVSPPFKDALFAYYYYYYTIVLQYTLRSTPEHGFCMFAAPKGSQELRCNGPTASVSLHNVVARALHTVHLSLVLNPFILDFALHFPTPRRRNQKTQKLHCLHVTLQYCSPLRHRG